MRTLTLVAFAGALVACGIPKEEHQKTLDELAKTQQDLAAARAASDKMQKDIAALEEDKKKLGGELTNVSNTNVNLEQQFSATKAELEELRKQRELADKRMQAFRDLAMKLKSMVDAGKLQVQIRKGKMMLRLPDNVLFASGSAKLKPQGQAPLIEVASALKDIKDREFVIAGHTDNVPAKGGPGANWQLSTQRAVEVVRFLESQGVNTAQLSASGYSEFDPIMPNDTPENKQANRRIEIIVMPNIEELPKLEDLPAPSAPASAPAH
jgi:chemotaxis protein MotB